jgi:hypothetical protein
MEVILQLSKQEEAKALPILLRHSSGVVLPNRTYVLNRAAVQALQNAGVGFRESNRTRRRLLMTQPFTKAEGRAFRERWRRVNAREAEELRSTSLDVKWRQFCTLLEWAHQFGWAAALGEGEAEVRERWMRLRKAHRGKTGKS